MTLAGMKRRSSNDSHSYSTSTDSTSTMGLHPNVEITVERLEGIIWSTPFQSASREELKKRVPFVTVAVEFAGTCSNMKVYSASSFPHSKNPAVESYFASLDCDPRMDNHLPTLGASSEIKKIVSTTTQEFGGTTTTTTTTTITTTAAPVSRHKKGQYPLVAKWHDGPCDDKLVDSVTLFTGPYDEGTLLTTSRKATKPHLTLTLPAAAEQPPSSILGAIFSPCREHKLALRDNERYNCGKDLRRTKTNSTAASTSCSSGRSQARKSHSHREGNGPFQDLESLLDQDDPKQLRKQSRRMQPATRRRDETKVSPMIATQKSKEMAATAIAAEPSSAVVGQGNSNKGVFTPLSWLTCATRAPELVELRVRVIPEDSDDFDEGGPSKEHLASAQELEAVAHLVFLDQIVEEGTTVMDLPLKISQDKPVSRKHTIRSMTPTVSEQDYVTLGSNAMLRVRVTVLPQEKQPLVQSLNPFERHTLHDSNGAKTRALPDAGIPFYSQPNPPKQQAVPSLDSMLLFAGEQVMKAFSMTEAHEENKPNRCGPFPHEFPTVVPDDKSRKVDSSFLGDWKNYGESWSWLRFSGRRKGKKSRASSRRKRGSYRHEARKFYAPQD